MTIPRDRIAIKEAIIWYSVYPVFFMALVVGTGETKGNHGLLRVIRHPWHQCRVVLMVLQYFSCDIECRHGERFVTLLELFYSVL